MEDCIFVCVLFSRVEAVSELLTCAGPANRDVRHHELHWQKEALKAVLSFHDTIVSFLPRLLFAHFIAAISLLSGKKASRLYTKGHLSWNDNFPILSIPKKWLRDFCPRAFCLNELNVSQSWQAMGEHSIMHVQRHSTTLSRLFCGGIGAQCGARFLRCAKSTSLTTSM